MVCLFAIILLTIFSFAQTKPKPIEREMDFDEAGEEETLNRQLWKAIKKTKYETALRHVRRAKQKAARPIAKRATLPNGWQIAPAGEQIEVGRLPFEAISYAG